MGDLRCLHGCRADFGHVADAKTADELFVQDERSESGSLQIRSSSGTKFLVEYAAFFVPLPILYVLAIPSHI